MVCRAQLETLGFPENKDESTNMAKTVRRVRPPTPFELEILKIVWELKTATVRGIYETLRERRRIAYTTVMTMMKIMEGKGQLKKSQAGRADVYKPTHSREPAWITSFSHAQHPHSRSWDCGRRVLDHR